MCGGIWDELKRSVADENTRVLFAARIGKEGRGAVKEMAAGAFFALIPRSHERRTASGTKLFKYTICDTALFQALG
jgi:hypothetical protein